MKNTLKNNYNYTPNHILVLERSVLIIFLKVSWAWIQSYLRLAFVIFSSFINFFYLKVNKGLG
jgi:hypothetical protein